MENQSYCLYGVANESVTAERVLRVGQIVGARFRSRGKRVIIGKDTRRPNYMLEAALVAGLASMGMDVINTGPVPMAGIAYLVSSMRCVLGVMITAPSDTFEVVGVTLFDENGVELPSEVQAEIGTESALPFIGPLPQAADLGRWQRLEGPHERIVEATKRSVERLTLYGIRIVIDCANGAAYRSGPEALWELGAEVIKMGVNPNGININGEGVGLRHPSVMIERVRELRADFGIALDAAGRNALVVDKRGNAIEVPQVDCNGLSDDGIVRALAAIKQSLGV